jgi:hypothetical protein
MKENTVQKKENTVQKKENTVQKKENTVQKKENTVQKVENTVQKKGNAKFALKKFNGKKGCKIGVSTLLYCTTKVFGK